MNCTKCGHPLDSGLKCWGCGLPYSFEQNTTKVMFTDFKFGTFPQPEVCPHCKRPYDENHAVVNIIGLNKQVNINKTL